MLRNIEYVISKIIKKLHLKSIKGSFVHNSSKIGAGTNFINSRMDRHSFCGYDCIIINTTIGAFCSIAGDCEIGGASHSIEWVSTSPVFNENKDQIKKKYSYHEYNTVKDTIIGNDVWIASKSIIKSGVEIGTGSVIGMGSVVTKDIPAYEIWAGNPAKFIRKRFNDDISEKLLSSEWWNFEDDELERLAEYVCDVDTFLHHLNNGQRGEV